MKNKYFLGILLLGVLVACSRRHKADKLHYFQDFETVNGWFELKTLTNAVKGHSGNYSVLTDPEHAYSIGFGKIMSEISDKPIRKIKATVWCYSENKTPEGNLCVQIVNPAAENVLWVDKPFIDFVRSEKKWTKMHIEAEVPPEAIQPNNTIKVFMWNKGTVPVYGDDFEVEFIE